MQNIKSLVKEEPRYSKKRTNEGKKILKTCIFNLERVRGSTKPESEPPKKRVKK